MRRGREDAESLSLSAYLTTERCTCCGCQVAGGLQAGQSCHGGVVLSGGGEWIWEAAQWRGSSRCVGLGCEVLRFRCGAQVARLESVLRGRRVEADVVRMFNRSRG